MKYNTHFLTLFFLIFASNLGFGQEKKTTKNPFSFFINSGIGLYQTLNSGYKLSPNGTVSLFQLQGNYKKKYFSRLTYNQFNLKYKDNFEVNGLNVSIDDRLATMIIGLDIGYVFWNKNKLNTYVFMGAGTAFISSPRVVYQQSNHSLSIQKQKGTFLSINAGVGAEYEFSKLLIVAAEAYYLSNPTYTNITKKPLDNAFLQIGFKTWL
jgi:hypothetical protein